MSHIFDALQKSVSDDSDIELPSALLATQLLEATERKTAAERASAAILEESSLPVDIGALVGIRQSLDAALSTKVDPEYTASTELPLSQYGVDQFSQSQTLKVLVPP